MSDPLLSKMDTILKTIILLSTLKCFAVSKDDRFVEELLIKPLPNGYVHASFHFSILWNATISSSSEHHYNLFPKAVGQIIDNYDVRELHLSLTQGLWRHDKWGYPVRSAPPGAELWAWFEKSASNSVDESWAKLVNSLSGLFCASLNFIDSTNTIQPTLSFRPSGVVNDLDATSVEYVRYATLPRENVCTENLTPWKKLLPCDSKAGLSTLFNAIKLYNAHYHALTIDLQPVCQSFPECTSTSLYLTQSISVVFRPTLSSGQRQWTLHSLFGNRLKSACPLASESFIHIDVSNESVSDGYTLTPPPSVVTSVGGRKVASYNVADLTAGQTSLNIQFTWDEDMTYGKTKPPVLHAHRFMAGYGQEKGGITCMIYNNHPSQSLDVIYLESLPWYVRLYLHTLKIQTEDGTEIKPDSMKYIPGKDRKRPYMLELMFGLPPASVITINIQFERAFLKWTEYPPDANIGFYLGSAVISAVLHSSANASVGDYKTLSLLSSLNTKSPTSGYFTRIYTEPLLLQLPLPDFSMPYNVICLVCTVFAIAFGSIHNLTTRRLDYEKEGKPGLLPKLKSFLGIGKKKSTDSKVDSGEKEGAKAEDKKSDDSISKKDAISKEDGISKEGASGDAGGTEEKSENKKND